MKTNINNNESANRVNNREQAIKEPQTITDAQGRQCYAFVLYIGGEISRVLTCGWWAAPTDAERTAEGMAIAARAFKKTAGVVAYALQDNDIYQLMFTKAISGRGCLSFKIHCSRLESGRYIAPTQDEQRQYFTLPNRDRYTGAECMPTGWNEDKTEGTAQYFREKLCASFWGGDNVPRLFEYCGEKLICVYKGDYWDIMKSDGRGLQEDLTLEELSDVLALYYRTDQKLRKSQTTEPKPADHLRMAL